MLLIINNNIKQKSPQNAGFFVSVHSLFSYFPLEYSRKRLLSLSLTESLPLSAESCSDHTFGSEEAAGMNEKLPPKRDVVFHSNVA
jgi:hypothetical protein